MSNVACTVAVALLLFFAAPTLVRSALVASLFAAFTTPFHTHPSAASQPVIWAQPAPNCLELVVNGDFEQEASGWSSIPGASLFSYATDQAVSGQQSLFLGFAAPVNLSAVFGVEQRITLPGESTSIEFAFSYAIEVEGEIGPTDQAYLTIFDATNNQLLAMLVLSPTNGVWTMGRYDLTPLAGKEVRLDFSTQNDGEPGRLAMRVDDVSIRACLPPESFGLQPLPAMSPTPLPPTPAPMVLGPLPTVPVATAPVASAPPVASAEPLATPLTLPVTPLATPSQQGVPQPGSVQPGGVQPGSIASLDQCGCDGSLYACTDFSSWAIAQACYTHCQVTAGYDIHNLDPDRNGIACELELANVAPLDATPSAQATPASITTTSSLNPNQPQPVTVAVTTSVATPSQEPPAQSVVTSSQAGVSTVITTTTATTTTSATAPTGTGAVTTNTGETVITMANSVTTVATVPLNQALVAATDGAGVANAGVSLTPAQMAAQLFFSRLGLLAIGVLVVLAALGLWIAYLLGRRGKLQARPAANPSVPDDFTLRTEGDIPAPKL